MKQFLILCAIIAGICIVCAWIGGMSGGYENAPIDSSWGH